MKPSILRYHFDTASELWGSRLFTLYFIISNLGKDRQIGNLEHIWGNIILKTRSILFSMLLYCILNPL